MKPSVDICEKCKHFNGQGHKKETLKKWYCGMHLIIYRDSDLDQHWYCDYQLEHLMASQKC
jgi:hypothetical protein